MSGDGRLIPMAPLPENDSGDAPAPTLDALLDDAIGEVLDDLPGGGDDEDEEDRPAARSKRAQDDDEGEDDPDADEDGDEDEEPRGRRQEGDEDEDDEDGAAEGDDEDEADDDDEDDNELADAWDALRASGVPLRVLKNTPRDTLIAWGQRVSERAGAAGDSGDDSSEATDSADPSAKKAGSATDAARRTEPDWSETGRRIADQLGVEPEAAEMAFKPFFDAHQGLLAEVQELRSQVESAASEARAQAGRAAVSEQMMRLRRRYPELKRHAEARQRVTEEATILVQGMQQAKRTIDLDDVFDKAAMLALGRPKRTDTSRLRRGGLSTPPSRRGGFEAEPTGIDDYFAKALDYVDRGQPHLARRLKPPKMGRNGRRR